MNDPIETEIKLLASPAMLDALLAHPLLAGPEATASLVTTYFDTAEGSLNSKGASLRIRRDGVSVEQTFKAPVSGHWLHRGEWNCPVEGDQPVPSDFPVRARKQLLRLVGDKSLQAIAASHVERTTRTIRFGSSTIAAAFDRGRVEGDGRSQPLCEVELELVEGGLVDVIGLALKLPLGPALQWSIVSKAERCRALRDPRPVQAVMAKTSRLDPAMTTARGFQAIAWDALEHLLANYPLVIADGPPEAVHQTRVALRRLRAALKLFGTLTEDEERAVLLAELKAAANGLGPARDLYVLARRVAEAASRRGVEAGALLGHLDGLRDQATRSAQQFLKGEPFQRLLLQLAGWIEAGEWHSRLEREQGHGGSGPLSAAAAKALSRLRRKVRSHGRKLAKMSEAHRHRLRIDVKKLRYAVAFVGPAWRDVETRQRRVRFGRELARLQDRLGLLNDIAVAARERDALFGGLDPVEAAGLGVQLGELLDGEGLSHRRLLKTAQTALDQVRDSERWWKPA